MVAIEFGEAFVNVRARLGRLDRDLKAGTRRVDQAVQRMRQSFDKVGRSLQRVGTGLTVGVTGPLVLIGKRAVETAADFEELQNLVSEVFGGATNEVRAFAQEFGNQVGRSTNTVLEATAQFGAFLDGLGVAPDRLAPMSKALTELSTDLGSFFNVADEEAAQRLFSGLAGETEAVRRFGVDLSAAAVDAQLLAMGIQGGAKEASQAEKVMARFNILLASTQTAQGDATRTAGSFQNQTRALGGALQELNTVIGQQIIPLLLPVVTGLRNMVDRMSAVSDETASLGVRLGGLAAIIGPAALAFGTILRVLNVTLGAFGTFGRGALSVMAAFGRGVRATLIGVQRAFIGLLSFIFSVPGAIVAAIAAAIAAVTLFPETLKQIFSLDALRAILDSVRVGFQNFLLRPIVEKLNQAIEFAGRFGINIPKIILPDKAEVSQETRDTFGVIGETLERELGEAQALAGRFGQRVQDALGSFVPDIGLGGAAPEAGEIPDPPEIPTPDFDTINQEATRTARTMQQTFQSASSQVANSLSNALLEGENAFKSLGNVAKSIASQILSAFIQSGINNLFGGGIGGGGGGIFGGLFAGGLQDGGVIGQRQFAVVGERGPELFAPGRIGRVIPNDEIGGGGGGVSVNQEFSVAFPPQLEAVVRNIAQPAARDTALAVLRAQGGRI